MSTIKPFGPPLTAEEEARLVECEAIIKVGLQNFVETGSALKEISDNRLYRKTHSDFDSYVKELWQMNARQAYRLIESADVVKQLESVTNLSQTQTATNLSQTKLNPNQARALSKVPPAERVAVLEKVSGQGKVTARAIQEAIEVEKPHTLDAQLLSALDMTEAKPLDEAPDLSTTQRHLRTLEKFQADVLETENATGLGQIRLQLEVINRIFKQAQKNTS